MQSYRSHGRLVSVQAKGQKSASHTGQHIAGSGCGHAAVAGHIQEDLFPAGNNDRCPGVFAADNSPVKR